MEKEGIVGKFRSLLNDFKAPYLLKLEEEPLEESVDIQDMQQVRRMLYEFDTLYKILKQHILDPSKQAEDIPTKAILSVFEKGDIFAALRATPSLKEDLIYYLNLDLKVYPFTRSVKHLKTLEENNVESHQRKIVPNLE
jgi:hypothetical protein